MSNNKTDILLVESLFSKSIEDKKIPDTQADNIVRLSGDASTRKYYRVSTDKGSYVACLGDPQKKKDARSTFLELQEVLDTSGVSVPSVHDFNLRKGYILQEDLGDVTLLKKLSTLEGIAEEFIVYKEVLEELIKIHNITSGKCEAFNISFDLEKLMSEVEFSVNCFIKNLMGYKISKRDKDALIEGYTHICKKLDTDHKVFTHRDYHSRNIMIKDDKVAVIDFQDARMGIPQYDLVSLLDDCYYNISQSNKHNLMRYYFDTFPPIKNWQSNFDKFHELYDYTRIQRTFKALGSFSYIYGTRKDERYLKYIGYGFEKLRKTLIRFPELKDLRIAMSKIYYEY